jgi:hypothetical protein
MIAEVMPAAYTTETTAPEQLEALLRAAEAAAVETYRAASAAHAARARFMVDATMAKLDEMRETAQRMLSDTCQGEAAGMHADNAAWFAAHYARQARRAANRASSLAKQAAGLEARWGRASTE